MENIVSNSRAAHKHVLYRQAAQQVASLISGVDNPVGALANVTAVLNDTFSHYLWVGFYRVDGDVLKLDVFQGSPACYTIARGKGVCGTAWPHCLLVALALRDCGSRRARGQGSGSDRRRQRQSRCLRHGRPRGAGEDCCHRRAAVVTRLQQLYCLGVHSLA